MRKWLLIILGASFAIRILMLGTNPAGVFHDEAEKGYSAYSLIKIGGVLDFTNLSLSPGKAPLPKYRPWPLYLDVWGSLTSMIYQYAAVPFIMLGGLNAWTTRLPAALVGAITVLLTFLLAKGITGNLRIALFSAGLLCFSPWHLIFSRWAQQGIFVPLFICLGLVLLLEQETISRKTIRLIGACICLGLAFYSYSGAQPFLLLFFPVIFIAYRRDVYREWRRLLPMALLLGLLMSPTLFALFRQEGSGMGRLNAVGIFALEASLPVKLLVFLKNYLVHFSPQFLFFEGDTLDRHGLRWFGQMLHIELLTLPIGLYLLTKRRRPGDLLLLGWFLLYPISAALTVEGIPHALRTLHAVPCPQIISAFGLWRVFEWLKAKRHGRLAIAGIACAFSFSFLMIMIDLFLYYPHYSAPSFEYGIREAIRQSKEFGPNGKLLISPDTGIPRVPELLLFHTRFSPYRVKTEGLSDVPAQFLAAPQDVRNIEQLLQKGQMLLTANLGMASRVSNSEAIIPIRWFPEPFVDESIVLYLMIKAKP